MREEVDSVNKRLENLKISKNLDNKIQGKINRISEASL